MNSNKPVYTIDIEFTSIKIPLVQDILILGKKMPQGKFGVMQSFKFVAPEEFELVEIDDKINDQIEAIIVNKKILRKMPVETVIETLNEFVFPHMTKDEAVKVTFSVLVSYQQIRKGDYDTTRINC